MKRGSSIVLVTATLLAGCRGSSSAPPPAADLNVAPLAHATVSTGHPHDPAELSPGTHDEEPASESARPAGDTCGLQASLRSESTADGAQIVVTLTNHGTKTVRLVVPGDGSDAAMRTPVLSWIATSGGKPAEPEAVARCGMTNPIEASEVFTLAPGASREMRDWVGQPQVKAGTYDVKLRFRNDPSITGNASPGVAKLVAATDACDVTSAPAKLAINPR